MDGAPPERADTEFDPALALAVQAFQKRHGLDADGAVGPRTRRALDTPASSRVAQLVANLERRRWLGEAPGKRQVRVNTAAFTLDAIDGARVVLHMRVVVGQPFRPTPEFSDRIRYLVLNPYWEVPPSLAVEDELPLIRRDPGYLAREHIRVLQGWGEQPGQIDPASVDWRGVGSVFPYRLRQDPGPWNALGRVKFMFPNAHNVYLHDTPARALFGQAGAVSARAACGCMMRLRWPSGFCRAIRGGLRRRCGKRSPVRTRAPCTCPSRCRCTCCTGPPGWVRTARCSFDAIFTTAMRPWRRCLGAECDGR